MPEILEIAKSAAHAAGTFIADFQGASVRSKGPSNLVTDADIQAQQLIVEYLRSAFPSHAIIGEEGEAVSEAKENENVWIVDPLDGTTNFAHGLPHYSVSIAYTHKGAFHTGVVYDPLRDEMFWAQQGRGAFLNGSSIQTSSVERLDESLIVFGFYYDRGELMRRSLASVEKLLMRNVHDIRRTGSAALDCCWVACGRFDAFFEYKLSLWDFAAGVLIAMEAGATVSNCNGKPLGLAADGVVVASSGIYDTFMDVVALRPVNQ